MVVRLLEFVKMEEEMGVWSGEGNEGAKSKACRLESSLMVGLARQQESTVPLRLCGVEGELPEGRRIGWDEEWAEIPASLKLGSRDTWRSLTEHLLCGQQFPWSEPGK